jgi:CBS domain-containing protein
MDRSRLGLFVAQRLADLPLVTPAFVSPADSVASAVALMQREGHSCVLATRDGQVAGIFTERDVLMKCMGDGFDWQQPLEAGVLTAGPATISNEQTVADAIAAMHRQGYRTLPVVDASGNVLGILRLGDLLKHLAEAYHKEVLNLPPRTDQVMEQREGG